MRKYLLTWGALIVLTTATLLLSLHGHGAAGLIIAFAFSTVKATVVAWNFMHLSEETLSSRLALLTGALLTLLLVGLVVGDVALRPELGVSPPELIRR